MSCCLEGAIAARDMASLSAFLKMCSEMGLASPEVAAGKALYDELQVPPVVDIFFKGWFKTSILGRGGGV